MSTQRICKVCGSNIGNWLLTEEVAKFSVCTNCWNTPPFRAENPVTKHDYRTVDNLNSCPKCGGTKVRAATPVEYIKAGIRGGRKRGGISSGQYKHEGDEFAVHPVTCEGCNLVWQPPPPTDLARRLSCPLCSKPFWAFDSDLGKNLQCAHCHQDISLPDAANLRQIENDASKGNWTVLDKNLTVKARFGSVREIADAIIAKQILAADMCKVHQFAIPKHLRQVCDSHLEIRKLYDPVGAHVEHVASTTCISCILLGCLLVGVAGFHIVGWSFPLFFALGILLCKIAGRFAAGLTGGVAVGGAIAHQILGAERFWSLFLGSIGSVFAGFITVAIFGFIGRGIGVVAGKISARGKRLKKTVEFG